MADVLLDLQNVGLKTFFTDRKGRYEEYTAVLDIVYDGYRDVPSKKMHFYYREVSTEITEFPSMIELPYGGIFINECYDIRERHVKNNIENEVLKLLEQPKINLYIKQILRIISSIKRTVEKLTLENKLIQYQKYVIERLEDLSVYLSDTYIQETTSLSSPKIQWLGTVNLLCTLFYDLWKGQEKGGNIPTTKPLLKAEKNDLMSFLANNFIDVKGKPFSQSTLSDYLNSSKPEKRCKKDVRIEIM